MIFDLWQTLLFGTEDSAISVFYKDITGEEIAPDLIKNCMLIKEEEPRAFLEKFLEIVTPSNHSSVLLSLKNSRSPLYEKIITRFKEAIDESFKEIRWLPGAIELLEMLSGDYITVITANLWAYQKEYFLNVLKLSAYVDRCLFSCDQGMNKDLILKNIGDILKTDHDNMIYIGKSYEFDIVPAINANLSAIRIAGEDNAIFPDKMRQQIEEELDGKRSHNDSGAKRGGEKKREHLIVIPPFYKLLGSHNNRLNLGSAHLSAYLSLMGHACKIYHADSKNHENYSTRYQMVLNSIEFYEAMARESAYDEFEEYYGNNLSDTVFVTCGDILNPSFDSGNWDSSKKIARIVRRRNPKAFIVAIGPEIGNASEDFDLMVYGEVENLLPSIVDRKIRGKVIGTLLPENKLKEIPMFDVKNIVTDISPVSLDTIMWRRGCAGTCDFCRVAQINKGSIRYRSVGSVLNDIRTRYEKFGIRNFYIVDANFTSHKEVVMQFCAQLKQEFPDIKWRTESRFDTLDEELLHEMKGSGCTHLKLGLENALSERHHVRTKRVDLENAVKWIRTTQEAGINCVIYLMLGGKWFTRKQYEEMHRNTLELSADGYTISLFNPYPNTPSGISFEEWDRRRFTGSHLDIRLVDYWRIPVDIVEAFFELELSKGREDRDVRKFV